MPGNAARLLKMKAELLGELERDRALGGERGLFKWILLEVGKLHGLKGAVLKEFPRALANGVVGTTLVAIIPFAPHPNHGAVGVTAGLLQPN